MDEELPKVLISEADIRHRVDQLAAQISADYADSGEIVLLCVLKGAFILLADLSRRLTIPRSIEFIAVSSYEDSNVPSGAVRLVMDVRVSIEGVAAFIRVGDCGCGIKAQDLKRIFSFGYSSKQNGKGFGLHASANAMTEMGGALWAESDGPGLGASLVLRFPLHVSSPAGETSSAHA